MIVPRPRVSTCCPWSHYVTAFVIPAKRRATPCVTRRPQFRHGHRLYGDRGITPIDARSSFMSYGTRLHRIAALLTGTSLSLASIAPAYAQNPADGGGASGGDPPAVAGQLTDLRGSVSFHAAGQDQWSQATANYPMTAGDAVYTDRGAHAAIVVEDDRIVLDEGTEVDIGQLDQQNFVTTEPQGATFLCLPTIPQNGSVTVNTPRGAVSITTPGRYEIVAGDTQNSTMVTVL